MKFYSSNHSINIRKSIGTLIHKVESIWECVGYSLTLFHTLGNVNVITWLHFQPTPFHVLP